MINLLFCFKPCLLLRGTFSCPTWCLKSKSAAIPIVVVIGRAAAVAVMDVIAVVGGVPVVV